ncbi:MAG: GTP 3',8-cyclase MoaA [Deltaproteobacteria bacterium]|nr:GTP 3',8-cyclase MoaA [Deltaproteobacteria bacterium]MBW2259620.1 GTP 3',8-cyclase MoaA [Deltaproteobacteria bacterium]
MAPNIDPYNREITYLRVSVTDRCNLRCTYCMPVKDLQLLDHADILRYEEILNLIEIAADLGMRKIRLTGGEPLIRRGFIHFVGSVCRIPKVEDVSITTNGVFLKEMAAPLFEAGLRRVNVSLDTLNPLKYEKITGRACFNSVWEGLQRAEAVGFRPIKVNVVIIKGLNDDELYQFADLSIRKPYHIRFIEYMPIGRGSSWESQKYMASDEIKSMLERFGPLNEVPRSTHDGPVERYRFKSAKGEVGFIGALSHHFCPSCNRLRLTPDGKLRPCLFSDDEVDIKSPLRTGRSREGLKEIFLQAIARKPRRHHAGNLEGPAAMRAMSMIGG